MFWRVQIPNLQGHSQVPGMHALKQLGCVFFEGLGATRAGWGHLLLALCSDVLMIFLFFQTVFSATLK